MKTYKVEFFKFIGSSANTENNSFKTEYLTKKELYDLPYIGIRQITKKEQQNEINEGLKNNAETFTVWTRGCKTIINKIAVKN